MERMDLTAVGRRSFLKASAIAGVGFSIGSALAPLARGGNAAAVPPSSEFGHFLRIANDNTVTVVIKHLDKGQGVTTGLTAIAAEELDADWGQMRWEFAPVDAERYNNLLWGPVQGTGGSTSIANSWMQLRRAGAAARQMLVAAAARQWGVAAADIAVERGTLSHASGRRATFGELAELAAAQVPPAEPALKSPDQFRLIGRRLPRIDSPEKSRGGAIFTADIRRPGMVYAVMAHPPVFGASLKSLDASAALALAGVTDVVETPRGVGVVAESLWTAIEARKRLELEWHTEQADRRGSAALWQDYRSLAEAPGQTVAERGDVAGALQRAERTVELDLEFPYLAHAAMEPMNCVVDLGDRRCEIWAGLQTPTLDQLAVAELTGLSPGQVQIHTCFAGGSFGRRAALDSDYVVEAVMIARAMKRRAPVSLQWSREDDMRAGRYRPMALHRLRAGIDAAGNISYWRQQVVSQSILRDTAFAAMITGPVDVAIFEGSENLPYRIPNWQLSAQEAPGAVPVLWWRSVGHNHNAYAKEVFLDELALALGEDPVALRLRLLGDQAGYAGVLRLAAEKAAWGRALPDNRAQGVALHRSFNTTVAQVAEVTLAADGSFSVDKIVCAVDCGIAVTPDIVRAQMEGGIGYGLSAILGEEITLSEGRVEQSNFHDYRVLRIDDMPDIEVHIMPSNEPPTGVGEPATPVVGPAVANALRRLLGAPVSRLPMGDRLA